MSFHVSKEEPGFILSGVVHVAILVIGLLGLADAKKFDDAQESLAVEVITESQLKQITKGEKTAKEVLPDAKLRVDKIAPIQKQDEPAEKKPEIAAPLATPLPPVRPVETAKAEPKKVEPAKAEPKEVPLPPKQIAVLPPAILPPSRPPEPKKVEPAKKVVTAPSEEDEADKEAEVIRQALRKKAEQQKQEQAKALDAKKLKEQQEAAEQAKQELAEKREDAKKLAEKQAEQKRLTEAKVEAKEAEDERKAEAAEKAEEAKKLLDAKKANDAKKVADAKKLADAKEAKETAEEAKAEKAEQETAAKAKAIAEAKKKELAAAKAAVNDAEAKRQADFDKIMRSKLASNSQNSSSGSNGKQTPTEKTSSTTGSTGRELSSAPSNLGSPTASGPKMNPAQREGLQDIIKNQMLKCWSAGSKPSALPLIRIQLNSDGTLQGKPQLVNSSSDPVFNSVAESGMRAIRSCAPYKIPPTYAGFFNDWKNSTIKLDPSDL